MKSNIFKNPDAPPTNFIEYMMKLHKGYDFKKAFERGIFYPCTICDGDGRVHDPADRDPVEGYKLAPLYKCKKCDGSGYGTEDEYWKLYQTIVEQNKIEIQRLERDNKTLTSLLKKINPAELALIYRVTGTDLSNIR